MTVTTASSSNKALRYGHISNDLLNAAKGTPQKASLMFWNGRTAKSTGRRKLWGVSRSRERRASSNPASCLDYHYTPPHTCKTGVAPRLVELLHQCLRAEY
ncbi:hypothetical protein E2C01_004352 [Portunus trituberculatus]|uniref:Uncharacterized protein n=1 Tax=Portunus trituberculatus TaxID=210409 RepID=A0A5B7CQH0_PORTR|nr:hypothetical protein [Portunus trituberculatus]